MDAKTIRIKVCFHSSPKTHKYWYNVSLLECRTIQQFADELLDNHLTHYEHRDLDTKTLHMKITIDDFELPVWESSNLLREGDLVHVCLTTGAKMSNVNRKRKHSAADTETPSTSEAKKKRVSFQETAQKFGQEEEENWDDEVVTPKPAVFYEACLVGSSMIRSIDPKELVSNRKVLFRSLSGGRIRDLYNYLTSQEQYLVDCRLFVITIGSNDCDSHATMSKIYQDLTELATYLESTYPEAQVVWNLLVPRLVCRYTKVDEFELKRTSFNEYVKSTLATHLKSNCVHYASHPSFEVDCQESEGQKTLSELLSDGVHISTIFGLSKYVAEINESLKEVSIIYKN